MALELAAARSDGATVLALPSCLAGTAESRPGRRWQALAASNRALVLAALILAFVGYRWGEKITVSEGFGWDGVFHGEVAADFYGRVVTTGVDAYRVQRILPSTVVHYGMRLLKIPRTKPNLLCAFGLLTVGLLTLAAWAWCLLADSQQISVRGKWLGFVGLFVNFAILKWSSYYAVLTDAPAFVLGMLMLYCYLTDRRWGVIALTCVGAFTWPMLVYHGLLLVMFPRGPAGDVAPAPSRRPWHQYLGAAVALTVCVYQGCLLLGHIHHFRSPVMTQLCETLCNQPGSPVVLAAVLLVLLYLWLGVALLWNRNAFYQPRFWRRALQTRPVLTGMAILLASKGLATLLARFPNGVGFVHLLEFIAWMSIKKPGLFAVAHVVFFGPILLLAGLYWRRVCAILNGYGLGLTLCVSANLLLSLDSESRHLIHCFPILVFAVVKAMEDTKWGAIRFGSFTVLALILSKCWLKIGGLRDAPSPEEFPGQLLFMNLGPWMSWQMYVVQGSALVVAAGIVLALVWRSPAAVAMPQVPQERAGEETEPLAA